MRDVVILGAGVMGTAMTFPAAAGAGRISLVGTHLDAAIIDSITADGRHPRLRVSVPAGVRALPWTGFAAAMAERPDLVILGVSTAGIPWAIDRIVESVAAPLPVLLVTKGLVGRGDAIELMPDLVAREIARRTGLAMPVMAIGGPCIAGELAARRDTSVVVAGSDPVLLQRTLRRLAAPFYHARASLDVTGVEVCAAFKNFYAIAVGAVRGILEREGAAENGAVMHNLAAALFHQALAEMEVLVEALGGDPKTVAGPAGAGDLYVTCQAGRNARLGRLLGLGLAFSIAKSTEMADETIEGAQLAIDLGPTLETMMATGTLPADRMPLAAAIIAAICRDAPLRLDFDAFGRTG
jgi:glycerol-3-phosphate dehydrogenase (NAD(P)+)